VFSRAINPFSQGPYFLEKGCHPVFSRESFVKAGPFQTEVKEESVVEPVTLVTTNKATELLRRKGMNNDKD
jgi:hypothetical protein